MTGPHLVFDRVVLGQLVQRAVAHQETAGVADVGQMQALARQANHDERRPDAKRGIDGPTQGEHALIDRLDERVEIPVAFGRQGAGQGGKLLDRLFGRLGATGEPANAIGHGKKPQLVIAKVAILVFFANLTDVRQSAGTNEHGWWNEKINGARLKRKA